MTQPFSIKESSQGFIEPSNCTPEIKMVFFSSFHILTFVWGRKRRRTRAKRKSPWVNTMARSRPIVNWQNDDWKNENEFQLIQTDIINIVNEFVMCYLHTSIHRLLILFAWKSSHKRVHAERLQSANRTRSLVIDHTMFCFVLRLAFFSCCFAHVQFIYYYYFWIWPKKKQHRKH